MRPFWLAITTSPPGANGKVRSPTFRISAAPATDAPPRAATTVRPAATTRFTYWNMRSSWLEPNARAPLFSYGLGRREVSPSHAEADVHDVAVPNSIVSSFGPQEAHLPRLGHGPRPDEV